MNSLIFAQSMILQTTNRVLEFELSEIANITFSEDVSAEEMELIFSKIPSNFLQNSPNPFNPETTISFELKTENCENIELAIYNLKGQKVKDLTPSLCHPELVAGRGVRKYRVSWNGRDDNHKPVASGVYFYKLQVDGKQKTKKMLLLK